MVEYNGDQSTVHGKLHTQKRVEVEPRVDEHSVPFATEQLTTERSGCAVLLGKGHASIPKWPAGHAEYLNATLIRFACTNILGVICHHGYMVAAGR